jgi:hypothetical protein
MHRSFSHRISFAAACIALVLISACSSNAKSYQIKTPAQALTRYDYKVKQTITVGMFGMGKSTHQTLDLLLALKHESEQQWTVSIEQLKFSTDIGDKKSSYDSKSMNKGDSSLLNSLLAIANNRTYHFSLAADGSVSEIVCNDSICFPPGVKGDSLDRYMTLQMADGIFGENAIGEVVNEILGYSSDKPLEAAGLHKTRTTMLPFPVVREEKYTVEKLENGTYFLKLTSQLHPKNDKGIIELGGKQITYDFKGEELGDMQVEEKSGILTKASYSRKLDGSISMQDMKGMMGNVKPNMTIERQATIKKI